MTEAKTFYVGTYKDKRIGGLHPYYWQAFMDVMCSQWNYPRMDFKRDEEGSMRLFIRRRVQPASSQHPDDDMAKDHVAMELFPPWYGQSRYYINEVTIEGGRIVMIDGRTFDEYVDDGLSMWNASPEERQKAIEDTYRLYGLKQPKC